jgi:hypothetical protein
MQTLDNLSDELELVIRRGTTFGPLEFEVADAAGVAVNLTGAAIAAIIAPSDGSAAVPWDVDVTLPNTVTITFSAAASAAFPVPAGYWTLGVTWPDDRVEEWAHGPVKFSTGKK